MNFTDIHSHILPGFDDGADNIDESLAMARQAAEGGTSVLVATPHYDQENAPQKPSEVAEAVGRLQRYLLEESVGLTLAAGMEVRLNTGLLELAEREHGLDGLALGPAGKYMLVDLTLSDYPIGTPDVIYRLQLRGYTPVLAHPERNNYLIKHPKVVREFFDRGIELQVNSGSLEGIFGTEARRTGRALLKEGIARLVASDAHTPGGRNPDLSRTERILTGFAGKKTAELVLEVNPRLVLEGQDLA